MKNVVKMLYKYRSFQAKALSIIINRELYFATPEQLNDPVDCQVGIADALKMAIARAEQDGQSSVRSKIEKLIKIEHILQKMENDVKSTAVLSLSKKNLDVVMWSNYADEHRGFCLGFKLSEKFRRFDESNAILGMEECFYTDDNPFLKYLLEFGSTDEVPPWDEFWPALISIGLVAKSKAWEKEEEVRVIRGKSGTVSFSPSELREVIFGLKMSEHNRYTIKNLLSSPEWDHVKYRKVVRHDDGFALTIVDECGAT